MFGKATSFSEQLLFFPSPRAKTCVGLLDRIREQAYMVQGK